MGYTRPATWADAEYLAPRLREIDIEECRVMGGNEPIESLKKTFDLGADIQAIVGNDGDVIGLFGVTPCSLIPDAGIVWGLFSDALFEPRHTRQFIKGCHGWVSEMSRGYSFLFNFISVKNIEAIRWLEWMGFKLPQMIPDLNGSGEAYYYFERTSNV